MRGQRITGLLLHGCLFVLSIALVDTVKADHGFRSESRAFKNLLRAMSELNKEERRQFLQFITGSPKLPIGGTNMLPKGRTESIIISEYCLTKERGS